MKRNLSIDLVKIIAMFMVLALHVEITGLVPDNFVMQCNLGYSSIAIPMFFMVSGFLMAGKQLTVGYSWRKIRGILKFVFITVLFFCFYWTIYNNIIHGYNTAPYFNLSSLVSWFWQDGLMWQYWYFGSMIIVYATLPLLRNVIHSKKLIRLIAVCIAVSFVFFILNLKYNFEGCYIRQTYRVWYWFMYFFLGAYIRQNRDRFMFVKWKHAILMCVVYTCFQVPVMRIANLSSDEYFFGSVLCMLYAISVFCACLNTKIESSKIISMLSSLFLPVYAIHPATMTWLSYLTIVKTFNPVAQYLVAYLLSCVITLSVAYILMKIPYVKGVFKI